MSEVGLRRAARERADVRKSLLPRRAQCFSHIVERGFRAGPIQRFWQDGDRARSIGVVRWRPAGNENDALRSDLSREMLRQAVAPFSFGIQ